jgi:hypothetical protein
VVGALIGEDGGPDKAGRAKIGPVFRAAPTMSRWRRARCGDFGGGLGELGGKQAPRARREARGGAVDARITGRAGKPEAAPRVTHPEGQGAIAIEEAYGWELGCGHPSRRPPPAVSSG